MRLSGWLIMCGSWLVIIGLSLYCTVKVLTTRKENIHAPLDIDTGDLEQNGKDK